MQISDGLFVVQNKARSEREEEQIKQELEEQNTLPSSQPEISRV